jgi:hypothetical protein
MHNSLIENSMMKPIVIKVGASCVSHDRSMSLVTNLSVLAGGTSISATCLISGGGYSHHPVRDLCRPQATNEVISKSAAKHVASYTRERIDQQRRNIRSRLTNPGVDEDLDLLCSYQLRSSVDRDCTYIRIRLLLKHTKPNPNTHGCPQ